MPVRTSSAGCGSDPAFCLTVVCYRSAGAPQALDGLGTSVTGKNESPPASLRASGGGRLGLPTVLLNRRGSGSNHSPMGSHNGSNSVSPVRTVVRLTSMERRQAEAAAGNVNVSIEPSLGPPRSPERRKSVNPKLVLTSSPLPLYTFARQVRQRSFRTIHGGAAEDRVT